MNKTIANVLGGLALLGLSGCYNTLSVANGGLVCGLDDQCPDGFRCLKDGAAGQPGHCWKNGTGPDAGGGATDGLPPKSDVANPLACTVASAVPPFGPFATCSPQERAIGSSTCDPVCQAGCPCDRRCVLDEATYASFYCEDTAQAPSSFVPVQGACNSPNAASCAPGSVCISDDVCPWLCYKTCRKDVDCPKDSRCSLLTLIDQNRQPLQDLFLCTPPIDNCNPSGSASCSTARPEFACVFLAGLTGLENTDATVCDCRTFHDKKLGAACQMKPDDCQPGAVCVDGNCRQICDKRSSGGGSACPTGSGCTAIHGSTVYGYCR
jgi:hypothetical protein